MAGKMPLRVTVVAQDPGVPVEGATATSVLDLPWEVVGPGPVGHRAQVIDYDATTNTLYAPSPPGPGRRKFAEGDLEDRNFHARNVFGLVMHTLGRFEAALGRRVDWAFASHQLKLVPHAFEMANAFYARDTESIVFGYFTGGDGRRVFTCLSHDVVVHETSHALLDGLRSRFMAPSSPDQGAFHEAFADIVAMLTTFTFKDVVGPLLGVETLEDVVVPAPVSVETSKVTLEKLKRSVFLSVADRFLDTPDAEGSRALRHSVLLPPSATYLTDGAHEEVHDRAEILVAAVMNAFVEVWSNRLQGLGAKGLKVLPRERVAEEGVEIARQLLTMVIRAIDYTPPIHIEFPDFLAAALTADFEVRPDDGYYDLRGTLMRSCESYGIHALTTTGRWLKPGEQDGDRAVAPDEVLDLDGANFSNLRTDPAEMFRLVWNNQQRLRMDPRAYTHVESVRPCVRVGPEDGQLVHETVAECLQYLSLSAEDLPTLGLTVPAGVAPDANVVLEGGSTLILDEFGRLKYEISNRLPDWDHLDRVVEKQRLARLQRRIEELAAGGYLSGSASASRRVAELHRARFAGGAVSRSAVVGEVW